MDQKKFESLFPEDTRASEIEKVLGFIKNGGACEVIAIPGVGKETLFELLVYNRSVREKHLGSAEKQFHFVLVEFAEIRHYSLFDVTKFLFLALSESLRERKLQDEFEKVESIFKEAFSLHDDAVLFTGLKRAIEYLTEERELSVIFLFDRFKTYFPEVTGQFFANLSVLRNRAKHRFSVVFSLNRPLEQSVEPILLSDVYPLISGHEVYVSLHDEVGLRFRFSYIEKLVGKKLPGTVRSKILQFTSGLSKMAKICAEEYLANLPEEQHLEVFFSESRAVRSVSYEIWEILTPQEQTVLKRLVLRKTVSEEDAEAVSYLTNVGILREQKITIPLFAEFVKYRSETIESEKITYNESTREITRGESILSKKLTAAEYRLLAYLLSHAQQVVGRDEIIRAVWQETKTTEGVTDQAIDQLIFRLRRKIEEEPNKPKHLQTVKGRGVMFIP